MECQARPALIESAIVILFAVREIEEVGSVVVREVDVPVPVPVTGEDQAAAVRRPGRIRIVCRIASCVYRRSFRLILFG